jgi:hypothetical protein
VHGRNVNTIDPRTLAVLLEGIGKDKNTRDSRLDGCSEISSPSMVTNSIPFASAAAERHLPSFAPLRGARSLSWAAVRHVEQQSAILSHMHAR